MKLSIQKNANAELKNPNLPDILSVRQVGKLLGIGRVSVYHLIEENELNAFRIGRVYYVQKRSVSEYVERRGADQ